MSSPTPPPGALRSSPLPSEITPPLVPPSDSRGFRLSRWYLGNRPALALVGLSILIPELLTGSTPVASLVNPVGDLFLLGLYGGGVLLIRDVSLRWNRGWGPVLLLGAAYGIVEEAIGTKTFFDWAEIGRPNFGAFTHWGGVNWVWAGELTLFHAIFSIALPIALVAVLFPGSRGQRFLSERGVGWTLGAFLVTVTAMYFLFDPRFVLAPLLLVGSLVAIAALVLAAWKIPAGWLRPRTHAPTVSPRAFFLFGVAYVTIFFVVFLGLPGLLADPFPAVVVGWAFSGAALLGLRATIGDTGSDSLVAFLSIGLLTGLLFFTVFAEFRGDLFAFLAVAVTIWLMVHLYRRYRTASNLVSPDSRIEPAHVV